MAVVRRSLLVLGAAVAVLVISFVALFGSAGNGNMSPTGSLPALTTTTTAPTLTTVTTVVILNRIGASNSKITMSLVTVPNVVGLPFSQADAALGAVGLGSGVANPSSKPGGQSDTGTVLNQFPAAGTQTEKDGMVQLTLSGY